MGELQDLRDFLEQPTLVMPIGGRKFTVEQVNAAMWLRMQEMFDRWASAAADGTEIPAEDDLDEQAICKMALGPTYEEMLPHVKPAELRQAGFTAFYWQLGHESVAELVWATGGKAPAAQTETPDLETPPASSTSTEPANTTPPRASTKTTTSRPRQKRSSSPRPAQT